MILSEIKTLLRDSSYYFVGQIIIMAAGFISFPVLTRIFSVADYGILGLITTTLLIAIAISKLGFPNSIVRFYAEFKSKNQLVSFYSTMFLGTAGLAASIAALFAFTTQLIGNNFFSKNIIDLFPFAAILIFTGCTLDTLNSFFRAEQRVKSYSLLSILRRYGSLAVGIFFVLYVSNSLFGFFLGEAISGTMIFLSFLYIFCKKEKINFQKFSFVIFKDSIKFGFPLIWAELGHLFLHYTDRYLIQLYLGSTSLGLYTAGYNLATYVTEIIMYPINYAIAPIYMTILVNKGEEKTRQFFTNSFRYFLLIMLPIVFGFIDVGKDLISFLASEKYVEAYSILPYVVVGQSIYACTIILNSGLFMKKKTYIMTNIMGMTCLLNIAINMLLIPRFGIIGAGRANLISNVFYTIVITHYAFKEFSFRIDYRRIIMYFASSLVMFIIIRNIHLEDRLLNLVSKVGIGAIIYSSLVLLFDKEIRSRLTSFVRSLKKPRVVT